MTTINERLAIGKKAAYTSNICSSMVAKNVGSDILDDILSKLPQTDEVWLKLGKGEILVSNKVNNILNEPKAVSSEYISKEVYDKMVENYERTIVILQEYVDTLKNK